MITFPVSPRQGCRLFSSCANLPPWLIHKVERGSQEGVWEDGGKRSKREECEQGKGKGGGKTCEGRRLRMLSKRQWWPAESSRDLPIFQPASLPSLHEAYGTSCFWFNQTVLLGLGEMSQQLRTPAALAEDLSMIPGIHTRGLTTTAGPGDPMSSSCFPGHRKT